jgi:hypothetical protein
MIHLIDVLLPEHEIAQSVSRYPDWEVLKRERAADFHWRRSCVVFWRGQPRNHHAKMACRFRKSDSCASMVEHCAA